MHAFYESFQKELGKRTAQALIAALTTLLSATVAMLSLPNSMHTLQAASVWVVVISSLVLASILLYWYEFQRLPIDTRSVLLAIFRADRDVSIEEIAQRFGWKRNKAEFHIADLMKKGFVQLGILGQDSWKGSIPTRYSLTTKGQK